MGLEAYQPVAAWTREELRRAVETESERCGACGASVHAPIHMLDTRQPFDHTGLTPREHFVELHKGCRKGAP